MTQCNEKDLRDKYLNKGVIPAHKVTASEDMRVVDLVDGFAASGAFNAGRLAEASKLFLKMAQDKEDTAICLTLSGALTPTGMGGLLRELIEAGLVDFIISTGANIYHDLHFALDLPMYRGDFRANDSELRKAKIYRIYDMFVTDEVLVETDSFLQTALDNGTGRQGISSAQLHHIIGNAALKKAPHPERSFVAQAARLGVPVFTSSPGDSAIGMMLALLKLHGSTVTVDPDLDVLQTAAIIHGSKKNGVITLGGGSPKNFYMQTQPMLEMLFGRPCKGHDYFIQITTDSPQWGGLSGATPQEAVSWGKVKKGNVENNVVVYCDATIAAPILMTYGLARAGKRPQKRLYEQLPELVAALKRDSNPL
ncbi:MAG: deoxyhypusine synthase [Candidatus Brocadiales bacterium]|jgi:deoxyhypusine synthase